MTPTTDVFNVPPGAKLSHPPKKTDYVAIACVIDDGTPVGYARVAVTDWTTGRGRGKVTRPFAEVLVHHLGPVSAVPDDGLIGEDDPAYEALKRGDLLWSGHRYTLRWLEREDGEQVHAQYFA